MYWQIIGLFAAVLFIFFGVKHTIGLNKVQAYLKNSNDDFFKEQESGLVKLSTTSGTKNKAAYEYIWSQMYSDHADKNFVLLCHKTFKSGLFCILSFVLIIVFI